METREADGDQPPPSAPAADRLPRRRDQNQHQGGSVESHDAGERLVDQNHDRREADSVDRLRSRDAEAA